MGYELDKEKVFPNFDADKFPFVIEYTEDNFKITNLKTHHRDTLIQGSAGNSDKFG